MRTSHILRCFCSVSGLLGMVLLCPVVSVGDGEAAQSRLATIVKKAAQEGEIVYQGPDPQTGLPSSEMLHEMSSVTERHYGVKIRVKLDNALSFPASTAKALSEIKAGAPPTFDLMYQTSVSGAPLYREKFVEPIPWLELFPHISKKDVEWEGLALINVTQFVLPAYNTQLVKRENLPRTWNDFLDPKWKGKLGMLIYPDPWLILSQPNAWGEEKTSDYLKKLMRQNPKMGRFPEVHERVLSGETPLTWGSMRDQTLAHKEKGARIDVVEIEPGLLWVQILFVPKGARHPNAAALVAAALLTTEGQNLMDKFHNTSSMFRPGTSAAEFASKRNFVKPDVDFQLHRAQELSKKIQAIMLGK